MSKITVVQPMSANPAAAWTLVGNPSGFSGWHPAIASSETQGDRRVCVLPDGAQIHERIVSHDDTAMQYTYEITDSPLPVSGYRSTISVEKVDNGCVVRWTAEFEPLGPAAEIEGMIRGLYEAGLGAAREALEA